jgi:ribosomal protein S3AE
MAKPTKIIVRRKKFLEAEIPLINKKVQLVGNNIEDLKDKTIKLDLTRQLRGKSIEATLKINIEKDKAIAKPKKIVLLPYFIRRMIRKRTSYVEDSIITPTQESMVKIKPFLITRKKVSRVVRKTLRNLTKNWVEDYLAEKNDDELFEDILSNNLQKPLSLKLKKTYPLSLCEIRVLEILRPLKPEEIPKKSKKAEIEIEKAEKQVEKTEKKEIEKAEKEIKQAQKKATKIEEKTEKKKTTIKKKEAEKTEKKK